MDRLSADCSIPGLPDVTITDFWSWAYSDVLSNRNRAVFAEFIVGFLLDVLDTPRIEWDSVDLRYKGKGIEVKSAAYLQSWSQNQPSRITFSIEKKKSWFADSNTYSPEPVRAADCYVFCLFNTIEREKANVLDLTQWRFWVVPSTRIDQEMKDGKSISFSKLSRIHEPVDYHELKTTVDKFCA